MNKDKKRAIGSYIYEYQDDWLKAQQEADRANGGTGHGIVTQLLCEAMDLLIASKKGEIPK